MEVELGPEFQFHSVFICPVSREQASRNNPPMLLQCGHVLCEQVTWTRGREEKGGRHKRVVRMGGETCSVHARASKVLSGAYSSTAGRCASARPP